MQKGRATYTLDDSLLRPDQKDIIQDLIVAAHADGRRKLEALLHPRFLTWGELAAASEAEQRVHWEAIMASWQRNYERELDADVAFDHSRERREMWGCGR